MKLHNTLTKQTEELKPLEDSTFRIYSCGPTVYDHLHIGNLSSFIFTDTLRRAIAASGFYVRHIMNITDVDDKTIAKSHETYPDQAPKEALFKLTNQLSEVFFDDMRAVGNDVEAVNFVKATDSIEAMQALIRELHEKGFAYVAEDGIYFSIRKYTESGKKYGQLSEITADSTSAARIQNDEYDKDFAHDFALWKKQKDGEPAWDFEIAGENLVGRPGWHIECSAMSRAALGQPFDIHTGGIDLIFPHHENEIAQSTASSDNPLYAKLFVHNEHLLADDKKMSKSLNNFYTLEDIKAKGFAPLAFRLLVLQSHYRKPVHFSWDNLTAAQNRLQGYHSFADLKFQPLGTEEWLGNSTGLVTIKHALQEDLNTPTAMSLLSGLAATAEYKLITPTEVDDFNKLLIELDAIFGLGLSGRADLQDGQKALIQEREAARAAQDWGRADELRGQLEQQGIGLRDTPHGAIWYRL